MEIAAAADDNLRSLRAIARKLIDAAADGKMDAIKELGDRLDGKVPQAIVGDDEYDPIKTVTRIELVAPSVDGNSAT